LAFSAFRKGQGALEKKKKKKKKHAHGPRRWVGAFLEISGSEKRTFVFSPPGPHELLLAADGHAPLPQVHHGRLKPIPSASPSRALSKCLWARGPSRHCTRTAAGRRAGPPEPRARRWESCAWPLPACLSASWQLAAHAGHGDKCSECRCNAAQATGTLRIAY
jgi:hypothetical protein